MNILNYLSDKVQRFPDKVALAARDYKYTFSELSDLSSRLGAVIRTYSQSDAVAVFVSRDIDTAVYFLACVYAGCFYVPVDPDMPTEKICSILTDCKPSVVLGDKSLTELYKSTDYNGVYLSISDIGTDCADYKDVSNNEPLYMIYTSGSTGKPKGVLKSHGAMQSYIEAWCKTFEFSENDIVGNQSPFFFDASAKDFYLMLKTGATLEIIPTEMFTMPPTLIEYMNERKVSVISWVPTALILVIRARTFSYVLPETLKKVFFVGEVMPTKFLNKWRSFLPDIQYVNLYGQSEISGICCYYEVTGDISDDEILPMGKELSNCKIYLLDGDNVITESNRNGEIFIVSDSLALEYYNDPEKTEKSFQTRDFGNGNVRCLCTGDIAHYDENGNLLFSSRADFQIKHMGHRIELGEIEVVAGALDEVDRCCCLYDKDKSQIVLFCELHNTCKDLTGKQIQSLLRQKLSSYMVPTRVNIVEKMPLNANSKIDRRELKKWMNC